MPARQVWVQERLLRILRGEACLVAAGIRRSATSTKARPTIGRMWIFSVLTICSITPLICTTDECLAAEIPDRYRRDRRRLPPPGLGLHGPHRSALVPRWPPKPCCGFALSAPAETSMSTGASTSSASTSATTPRATPTARSSPSKAATSSASSEMSPYHYETCQTHRSKRAAPV